MIKTFKRIEWIFIIIAITHNSFSQAPNWEWARDGNGFYSDAPNSIAVDSIGNSYVIGGFEIGINFDGIYLNNANSGTSDIFIVKYDALGNVVWAQRAGGNFWDNGYDIALDGDGFLYIAGSFSSDSITFGNTTLSNAAGNSGYDDIFIAKYDTSGNAIWAKGAGAFHVDKCYSIAVDENSNSYVTGYFRDSIIFDNITLYESNASKFFIAKFDSTGNTLWAKSAYGNSASGKKITIDKYENAYVTGTFGDTIIFGSTILKHTGSYAALFIAKYDSAGNVLWAKGSDGPGEVVGLRIKYGDGSNFYLTGYYNHGMVNFDSIILPSTATEDVFLAKYDSSGIVHWIERAGGSGSDASQGLTIDANGNSYIIGGFASQYISFGTTYFSNPNGANGFEDIFVAKYDSSGNAVWAKSVGNTAFERGYDIGLDANENLYTTGIFQGPTATFGSYSVSNIDNNHTDVFIAKLGNTTGITEQNNFFSSIIFYPNPTTSTIHLTLPKGVKGNLEIMNVMGEKVYEAPLPASPRRGEESYVTLDVTGWAKGMYVVRVGNENRKLIVE